MPARSLAGLAGVVAVLMLLGFTPARPAHSQTSVAAATGPVFLPGSGASADWHGLAWLGVQKGDVGGRLEAMYTGVPSADLVALTGDFVWLLRRGQGTEVEPYLVAGIGSYIKFSETRFGLNGGVGLRRRVGSLRLFGELRYHRVVRQFEEAHDADTFVPLVWGISLGR